MHASAIVKIGAISAGLAVVAGAFGAHGLEKTLDARGLQLWETAAKYQMYHGIALVAVGIWEAVSGSSRSIKIAAWAFLIGTILFSGSLYALALSGITKLGAITPLGGVGFIVGWIALAVHRGVSKPSVSGIQ
jgi:uncharacterized membrane protein YgdD (TMEM256/DUF423 family)